MSGNLRLYNSSGYVELQAPSDATSQVLELPTDSIKPGLVLLAQESFTAQSAVSVDSVFSAEYDNYRVVMHATESLATSPNLLVRLRVSGTDDSSSNYDYQRSILRTSLIANQAVNQTSWIVSEINSGYTGISFDLMGPYLSSQNTVFLAQGFNDYSSGTQFVFAGKCDATIVADGFTIYPTSGTMTGSLSIYGYRNS